MWWKGFKRLKVGLHILRMNSLFIPLQTLCQLARFFSVCLIFSYLLYIRPVKALMGLPLLSHFFLVGGGKPPLRRVISPSQTQTNKQAQRKQTEPLEIKAPPAEL